jgi:hypothetical protein
MPNREKPMRKLVMSLSVLAGLLFAGTIPASANAAAGLTAVQVPGGPGVVTEAGWHHGWGHHGWGHRGWGGRGLYFGFGLPYWGYYPRYRYYDYDDDYYYYRPYYYYGGRRWHHHYRYWGGHWGGYGHWRGHGHWHGHGHHHR